MRAHGTAPPHPDGGPPNMVLAGGIVAGGVRFVGLVYHVTVFYPGQAAEYRRLREMIPVEAAVVAHRVGAWCGMFVLVGVGCVWLALGRHTGAEDGPGARDRGRTFGY